MNRADSTLDDGNPRSLQLACAEVGPRAAPHVLVLHGITASSRYWLPRVHPLAKHYRLVVPDLPGFGQSPKPFVEYAMDFHVEAVLGLLERKGLDRRPLTILGHSLGSLVALEVAARLPDTVTRMVLLNLPRFADPENAHQVMLDGSASYRSLLTINSIGATVAQFRRVGLRLTLRSVRRMPWSVVQDARKFTFRSLSSTLEQCLIHHSADDAFRRCPAIPVLMIHGDSDQVAPVEAVRDLPSRPPHPTLHVIEGAGHHPLHTHTDHCLELIRTFLEGG